MGGAFWCGVSLTSRKRDSTGCVRQRLEGWKPHSNSLGLGFPTEVPGHIWWSLGVLRVWVGVAPPPQQVAGLIHTVHLAVASISHCLASCCPHWGKSGYPRVLNGLAEPQVSPKDCSYHLPH